MIRFASPENPLTGKVIKIEETVYVRDKHGVRRQAFLAGEVIPEHIFIAVVGNPAPADNVTDDQTPVELPEVEPAPNDTAVEDVDPPTDVESAEEVSASDHAPVTKVKKGKGK